MLGDIRALADDQAEESLSDRLADHRGIDPRRLPVLSQEFSPCRLVDVQVVVEARAQSDPGRVLEMVGVAGDQRQFHSFSELLARRGHGVGICPWSKWTWLTLQTRPAAACDSLLRRAYRRKADLWLARLVLSMRI